MISWTAQFQTIPSDNETFWPSNWQQSATPAVEIDEVRYEAFIAENVVRYMKYCDKQSLSEKAEQRWYFSFLRCNSIQRSRMYPYPFLLCPSFPPAHVTDAFSFYSLVFFLLRPSREIQECLLKPLHLLSACSNVCVTSTHKIHTCIAAFSHPYPCSQVHP